MSLVVETGAGLSNAQSYLSVADADVYHSARGLGLWENMTDPEKEMCLIRATDFMIQKYRLKWLGRRTTMTQRLDWPRAGVVIEEFRQTYPGSYGVFYIHFDVIPEEVKTACAELALRASISGLSEDQSARVIQETIGPVTVKYDPYSSPVAFYTAVHDTLRPYIASGSSGAMVKLTRC